MAVLIQPRRWATRKPSIGTGIDAGHPLAAGLVGAWLFHEGGGGQLSNLAAAPAFNGTLASDYTWGPNRVDQGAGSALKLGTSTSIANRTDLGDLRLTGDMTVVCAHIPLRTPSSTDIAVIGKWNTGGSPTTDEWLLGLNNTGGEQRHFFSVAVGSTVGTAQPASATWSVGDRVVAAGTRRGAAVTLYLRGQSSATVTGPAGAINTGTGRHLRLGQIDVGAGFNTNAIFNYAYLWSRALTPAEIGWLYAEPYAFFTAQSPRQRFWSLPPASVPINVRKAGAWASVTPQDRQAGAWANKPIKVRSGGAWKP